MSAYLWILVGYIVGATPFGFLAGKMKGVDIRDHGSHNIGSTNVLRILGKSTGYTVLVLDIAKGLVPVLLAVRYAGEVEPKGLIPVLTAVASILAHNYTFWLGFKGGKGIATSGGALFPLMPMTILAGGLAWMIVFFLTRYVSLASMAAAVALPVSIFVQYLVTGEAQVPLQVLTLAACVMAFWRHRSNIRNLRNGTEHKFTKKLPTG